MANSGIDTNGSQFYITFKPTDWLNGKHTVYGRVIHGMDICRHVEDVQAGANETPLSTVKIVECGELAEAEKLNADNADYL